MFEGLSFRVRNVKTIVVFFLDGDHGLKPRPYIRTHCLVRFENRPIYRC